MARLRARGPKHRSRLFFWVALVAVVFTLVSGALAVVDADACGGSSAPRHWNIFPPRWECGGYIVR